MRGTGKFLITFFFTMACASVVFAQPLPPEGVPLDPISWLLLAAGGAMAGKKIYDSRKNP